MDNQLKVRGVDVFFVPHDVPSAKNSKIKSSRGIFDSKTYRRWKSKTKNSFIDLKPLFIPTWNASDSMIIGFHFVRKSRRLFDFNNMTQAIQDAMVNHEWIDDDNVNCMLPVPLMINNSYVSYNKEHPGVYIVIAEGNKIPSITSNKFNHLRNFKEACLDLKK